MSTPSGIEMVRLSERLSIRIELFQLVSSAQVNVYFGIISSWEGYPPSSLLLRNATLITHLDIDLHY